MASNLVGQVRSHRAGGYVDCTVPPEPASVAGDWQVLAWVSHIDPPAPVLAAPWVRILNRKTTHSQVAIYKRQLTAATAGASSGITIPYISAHQGVDIRTYRGALDNVSVLDSGDGYVAPALNAIAGSIVRIWADSEANTASFPPDKIFNPPAGVTNVTGDVFRNFQWFNGLLTADEPTAVGGNAPSRTATVTNLQGGGVLTRFPQYVDVLLSEPVVNPATPINLNAVPTQTGATLSWADAGTGIAPDDYDYRINGGTPVDVNLATSVVVSGLTAGTNYTFEVRARTNAGGVSAWSAPKAFSTLPAGFSNLRLGAGTVADVRLGSSKVTKMYLGTTAVYDSP